MRHLKASIGDYRGIVKIMLFLVALAFPFAQKPWDQEGKCLTSQGSQREPLAKPLASMFLA